MITSKKIEEVVASSSGLKDKKIARKLRLIALDGIMKTAEQFGLLQNPTSDVVVYETREHEVLQRGGKRTEELYGVGIPDYKDTDISVDKYSRSLSTRYSPDRVGVQARRISDGVYQDPITRKNYNWNEGFKTEDGKEFFGGNVSHQTKLYRP